jgi:thiol-disulfide isomerase/thioredoxin
MPRIRLVFLVGVLGISALMLSSRPGAAPNPTGRVDLTAVPYSDLGARIKALRGKVVVVDFWADYCQPCKREFPKLVELHRKHSAAGLACISVDLDDADDSAAIGRVRNFLSQHQATFANFVLAEKPEVWQAKLKIEGPPCVFLFNRRGELVKKFRGDVDYKEIETIVVDRLKD